MESLQSTKGPDGGMPGAACSIFASGVPSLRGENSEELVLVPPSLATVDIKTAIKGFSISKSSSAEVDLLAKQILEQRGFSAQQVAQNLNPPEPLVRARLIYGIQRFQHLLSLCRESKEGIAFQVDYDADGLSAGEIARTLCQALDIPCRVYISSRHHQGYDVQPEILEQAHRDGYAHFIVADLGSQKGALLSEALRLEKFKSYAVIDHHQCNDDDVSQHHGILINPHQSLDSSGLGHLCASGLLCVAALLAFESFPQLSAASCEALSHRVIALSSIGTMADLVPLCAENRWLVKNGLEYLCRGDVLGIRALTLALGRKCALLNEESIAFFIGPALNSASRVSWSNATMLIDKMLHNIMPTDSQSAERIARVCDYVSSGHKSSVRSSLQALEVCMQEICGEKPTEQNHRLTDIAQKLLATESPSAALRCARALYALNNLRQGLEYDDVQQARKILQAQGSLSESSALFIFCPQCDIGNAGLVAARIAQEYSRPTAIVAALDETVCAGSVRAGPTTIDVGVTLRQCNAFLSRGGHAAAGGVKVERALLDVAREQWNAAAEKSGYSRKGTERTDLELALRDISQDLLALRGRLAPFGQELPALRIETKGVWVLKIDPMRGENCRVLLAQDGKRAYSYRYRSALPSAMREGACVDVVLSLHKQDSKILLIVEEASPTSLSKNKQGICPGFYQPALFDINDSPKVRVKKATAGQLDRPTHAGEAPPPQQSEIELSIPKYQATPKDLFGDPIKIPTSMQELVQREKIHWLRLAESSSEHPYVLRFRGSQVTSALLWTHTEGNMVRTAPTGAGKTVEAMLIIAKELSLPSFQRIIISAPTTNILKQWYAECEKYLSLPAGSVVRLTEDIKAEARHQLIADVRHRVVISSPDLINRLAKDPSVDLSAYFQVGIIDEGHIEQGEHQLAQFRTNLRKNGIRLLTLTATPARSRAALNEFLFLHDARYHRSSDARKPVTEQILPVALDGIHAEMTQHINKRGSALAEELLSLGKNFESFSKRLRSTCFVTEESGFFHFPGIGQRNELKDVISPLSIAHGKLKRTFFEFYSAAHMFETLSCSGVLPYLKYCAEKLIEKRFPRDVGLFSAFQKLSEGTSFASFAEFYDPKYQPDSIPQSEKRVRVRDCVNKVIADATFLNHPKDQLLANILTRHAEYEPHAQSIVPVEEVVIAKLLTARLNQRPELKADMVLGTKSQARKVSEATLDRFKAGEFTTLVGTSTVELGLDVSRVQIVVHHSVALTPEADEQRNGRCGRREQKGLVYRLITEGVEEDQSLRQLLGMRARMRKV